MIKKTIFSAVAPSGNIHIGNYFGAIKQWVDLQNSTDYKTIFCVVDEHAITVPQDPEKLRSKIIEIAALYLAAGIDPKKSIVFIQSHVSEHTELSWILNTITPVGELQRMTQFKDKAQKQKSVLSGLLNYPVLMAADILLYKTDVVPVGEDQLQHIELTREIARKFNSRYNETFTIPEPIINKEAKRIMGLDDPSKKMSKSAENSANYIALLDSPEVITKKIKSAVTDSGSEVKFDLDKKPAVSNLMTIYGLFTNETMADLEKKYAGKQYSDFKTDLAEVVVEGLKPIREKYEEIKNDPKLLSTILKNGAKEARGVAEKTMGEVRDEIGFV